MLRTSPIVLAATLFGALAAPALAQGANPMASTQYPPSPGLSSEGGAQPLNSMPESAATAVRERPGSAVGTTLTNPASEAADTPAG